MGLFKAAILAEKGIQEHSRPLLISPDIDRKWKYVRYWYSKALMTAGRSEEALKQIEIALRPGDSYLLNQKASVLSKGGAMLAIIGTVCFGFIILFCGWI